MPDSGRGFQSVQQTAKRKGTNYNHDLTRTNIKHVGRFLKPTQMNIDQSQ